jgi:putative FmdB family regulatory protein
MPIYEYECRDCSERFEVFVFSGKQIDIICPKCGHKNTEKLISNFSSNGDSGSNASSCGGFGGFS